MKPSDLRNATWADVREHLTEDMLRVHEAWRDHGPGTTRQVADRSGISLLTLRPRTTDLFQIGLVSCVGKSGTEGVYAFVDENAAAAQWTGQPTANSDRSQSLLREINALPLRDQISIAASILSKSRATKAARHAGGTVQSELFAS